MTLKPEMLLLYKEGRLGQDEKREVEDYLADHSDGHALLNEFDELSDSLETWGQVQRVRNNVLQAVKQERTQPRVIQLSQFSGAAIPTAVAACFIIALTGLLYMMQNQSGGVHELSRKGSVLISQLSSNEQRIEVRADSFLSLKMADEKSITEYAPETIATITGPRSLKIEKGRVWNEVGKADGAQYTVETEYGTIIVLGTQFEVAVDGEQATVRLMEGKVKLIQADGEEQFLKPNEEAVMKPNSKIQLAKITADDIARWRKSFMGKGITTRDIPNALQQTKNR